MLNVPFALILLFVSAASMAQQNIEITHFDIGQGDATLIFSRVNEDSVITVLFDAGGYSRLSKEDAGSIIHRYLTDKNIDQIDYLVVSHYDADHIGGIVSGGYGNLYETSFVLGPDNRENTNDDIEVITVVDRGDERPPSSTIYQRYIDFTESVERVSIEDRFDLDYEIVLGPQAAMRCLAANGYVRGRDSQVRYTNTENERSLSFLLSFMDFDYLISGDLIGRKAGAENAEIEAAVADFLNRDSEDIDVLHVNHHGADNTSEQRFLDDIQAEVAIISCGDGNTHGHPYASALQRLINGSVQMIFQTNLGATEGELPADIDNFRKVFDGHIVISTNGTQFEVFKYGYPLHEGYYYTYNCVE